MSLTATVTKAPVACILNVPLGYQKKRKTLASVRVGRTAGPLTALPPANGCPC